MSGIGLVEAAGLEPAPEVVQLRARGHTLGPGIGLVLSCPGERRTVIEM